MATTVRTTRTLKVTEQEPSAEARELLARLYGSPEYEALLDVMERGCISLETAHLNTSVGSPEEILGGHAVAKAAWLFFTWVQKKVQNAYHTRTPDEEQPEQPASLEDVIQGLVPMEQQDSL